MTPLLPLTSPNRDRTRGPCERASQGITEEKTGTHNNTIVTSPPTVVLPHAALSTYSPVGYSGCMDVGSSGSEPLYTEDGTICTAWIAQPSAATLQPLTHWAPCPEYLPLDGSAPTYTADMYVQPMCPSYAVVGPSSVLTYTSTPLFTNFAPRHPAPSPSHKGAPRPTSPSGLLSWAQPISALPAQAFQCPSAATPFTSPQLVPLPVTVPEPAAQELEEAQDPGEHAHRETATGGPRQRHDVSSNTLFIEGF
ncbi:POU domain class 2-associating factor 1 isoform X5 [Acipenser oxyrinchus oxyrinchus]|uniref:POU domain class 2-associating factor 1 isoform X5 n=1 Tax=Acipenser oxyrinchus oxyrinchus TaxID=40147 RepID=A0AAD8CFB7_ACIOX|nr:POU domain class 2-associating factor 1 isoform X5 [Acipenser oxyrinchus oxyrinchus]